MLLENKNILITGASRGIGLAVAERCLAEGARVVANYKNTSSSVFSLVEKYGEDRVLASRADISIASEVRGLVDGVRDAFQQLDGIVCNAGIITRTPDWKNISSEDWGRVIDTNLIGAWNVIRYGLELMEAGGSIVNISSIYGIAPEAKTLPYSVSKAAVIALTQALAKEVAPKVRINAILPGNTLTSMVPEPSEQTAIEERTLLKRSAAPTEIANAVVFLLSDSSSYMTGNIIPVDGGYQCK